jgi:hypothetical protein
MSSMEPDEGLEPDDGAEVPPEEREAAEGEGDRFPRPDADRPTRE